jgi:shikimate kinase
VSKLPSIFLIGPEGAGKSTVGQELARLLKTDFYDSDYVIEERSGVSISWIYDVEGEDGFRKREAKVIAELAAMPNVVLATGGGAILTAANRTVLASKGLVIYLKATVSQQLSRTRRKDHRPHLQVENVEEALHEMREEREKHYQAIADLSFETRADAIRSIAKDIYKVLQERGY